MRVNLTVFSFEGSQFSIFFSTVKKEHAKKIAKLFGCELSMGVWQGSSVCYNDDIGRMEGFVLTRNLRKCLRNIDYISEEYDVRLNDVYFNDRGLYELIEKVQSSDSLLTCKESYYKALSFKKPAIINFIAVLLFRKFGFFWVNDLDTLFNISLNMRRQGLLRHIVDAFKGLVPSKIKIRNEISFDRKWFSDEDIYAQCFDFLCGALSYNELSEKICKDEIEFNGACYWGYANLGVCQYLRDDIVEAGYSFSNAKNLALNSSAKVISTFMKGIFTWKADDDLSRHGLSLEERRPALHDEVVADYAKGDSSLVHLLGSDSGYFKKFSEVAVMSSLRSGSNQCAVHYIIIDPDADDVAVLEYWKSQYPCRFGYTILRGYENLVDPAYYASLRFICLPDILVNYKCPVVVTDVDMAAKMSWEIFRNRVSGCDLGICHPKFSDLKVRGSIRNVPWSLPAGYFYVSYNSYGFCYAKTIKRFILDSYIPPSQENSNYSNWYIDQVAIRQSLDVIVEKFPKVFIKNLSFSFMSVARKSLGVSKKNYHDQLASSFS